MYNTYMASRSNISSNRRRGRGGERGTSSGGCGNPTLKLASRFGRIEVDKEGGLARGEKAWYAK